MVVIIGAVVAGVVACVGLTRVLAARARRRRIPRFEVMPAVRYCRVRPAHELAAAWRASGFGVVERRRSLELRLDGGCAVIELSPARCFGDAVFAIRTERPELVHALAEVAARELGPLVCWIDGFVHGFDAPDDQPDDMPMAARARLAAGEQRATRVLRPAAAPPVAAATPDAVTIVPRR